MTMQVLHRISISATPEIRAELAHMAIVVGANGLVTFEVDESHESWPKVQRWISMRRAVDIVSTKFSKQEIAAAQWLELMPSWHHGYPQPKEDVFGYLDATYDLSGYCQKCGTGARQKAAFQMKAEPKWGTNGILQLNWIFDEFFVTPEVWSKVFEPYGIGRRHVLSIRESELKTVVQLVVNKEVDIVTDGLQKETCGRCGRNKYAPITRGPFPRLASKPVGPMVKTRQYFGSGASANKRVLISQEIARALTRENVRGASLRPIAEAVTGNSNSPVARSNSLRSE
jgi:hypothetical protein